MYNAQLYREFHADPRPDYGLAEIMTWDNTNYCYLYVRQEEDVASVSTAIHFAAASGNDNLTYALQSGMEKEDARIRIAVISAGTMLRQFTNPSPVIFPQEYSPWPWLRERMRCNQEKRHTIDQFLVETFKKGLEDSDSDVREFSKEGLEMK